MNKVEVPEAQNRLGIFFLRKNLVISTKNIPKNRKKSKKVKKFVLTKCKIVL